MPTELELRVSICEAGRRLWQTGLVGATEGNISCRLSERRLLVTPSGVSKGHMRPNDIVVTDLSGKVVDGGVVTSEIGMHVQCYQSRSDCQAVVHAHPLYASAFAVTAEPIADNILPEAMMVLGPVAIVPFGLTGTPALAKALEPFLADHKTFLLANHGATTLGNSVMDALYRMETLERVATTLYRGAKLGQIQELDRTTYDKLASTYLNGDLN